MGETIKRGDSVIRVVRVEDHGDLTFVTSPFIDEEIGLVTYVVGTTAWVAWPMPHGRMPKPTPHDIVDLQRVDVSS